MGKGSRSCILRKSATMAVWLRPNIATRSLQPIAMSISCRVWTYSAAVTGPLRQVRLEAARCRGGPGEPLHGRLSEELVGRLGLAPRQPGPIELEALQEPMHLGPADARQVRFHFGRQDQFLPPGQLLARRQQGWRHALRPHVVQALPDHPDHIGHRRPVATPRAAKALRSPL